MTSRNNGAFIEQNVAVMGGSPVIAGTRIRVADVVRYRNLYDGSAVEQIRAALPHLSPDQVNAALAYYRRHRREIDKEIEAEEELAARCQGESST